MDGQSAAEAGKPRHFVADEQNIESGSEELNLIEFPLGLLTEKANNLKTIESIDVITDGSTGEKVQRKCVVTGSDKWGLPNWFDIDLLLALQKLTKEQNNWTSREVQFTLYSLCNELRLPQKDGSYTKRLQEGILRLKATTICYINGWRKSGRWVSTEAFNLIDNVKLSNTKEYYDQHETQCLKWNDLIVESMQANNSKGLDWEYYLSLNLPTTKRLFRFLDKRFDTLPTVSYGLTHFCVNKMGMKSGQPAWKYRQSLNASISELSEKKFPFTADFEGRGKNSKLFFKKKKTKVRQLDSKVAEQDPELVKELEKELSNRGVPNPGRLVSKYPEELIRSQISNFDDRKAAGEKLAPGWLGSAIVRGGYSFRKGYLSPEARVNQEKLKAAKKAAEEKHAKAKQDKEAQEAQNRTQAVRNRIEGLGRDELELFNQKALEAADSFLRGQYLKAKKEERIESIETYWNIIVEQYVCDHLKAS